MKRILLACILFSAAIFYAEAQNFRTIKIGNQVWMAENLKTYIAGSSIYDEKAENGEKYGRLYSWEAAHKACPPGWHLPTDKEWQTLIDNLGGEDVAGKNLKNGGASGFNALLGGLTDIGNFRLLGTYGTFWTSSAFDPTHAWAVYLTSTTTMVTKTYFPKTHGCSVRYIMNK
jgi:uncharacterized protein (TIGR02145 family)